MSSSSSTPKGKGKAKTSPPISAGKRPLSLEEQIATLHKKIRRHETIIDDAHSEMGILEDQLKKKKKMDDFVETMTCGSCVICSRDLIECMAEPNIGLVSYECDCKKPRVVHLGCFTREFRCCCNVFAKIDVKSAGGKEVKVSVSEVVHVTAGYTDDEGGLRRELGLDDSDGDFN